MELWKRPKFWLGIAGLGLVALIVFLTWFAPKGTTTVEEAAPEGTALATGTWEGSDDFHHASGTVRLIETAEGAVLFFEDFDARSGPDVYLYGSTDPDGAFDGSAQKILVPGGAEDGQITLRGDFSVPLPDTISPSDIKSVILWCDDFSVHFGSAVLR